MGKTFSCERNRGGSLGLIYKNSGFVKRRIRKTAICKTATRKTAGPKSFGPAALKISFHAAFVLCVSDIGIFGYLPIDGAQVINSHIVDIGVSGDSAEGL